jgi:hypothetical protein
MGKVFSGGEFGVLTAKDADMLRKTFPRLSVTKHPRPSPPLIEVRAVPGSEFAGGNEGTF